MVTNTTGSIATGYYGGRETNPNTAATGLLAAQPVYSTIVTSVVSPEVPGRVTGNTAM